MTSSCCRAARPARLALAALAAGVVATSGPVGLPTVAAVGSPAADRPAATPPPPVVTAGRYSDRGRPSDEEESMSLQTGRKIG